VEIPNTYFSSVVETIPPPPKFRIGLGTHTGDAIVGNLGSPKRLE
jgi:class 3 adenylate cyclase